MNTSMNTSKYRFTLDMQSEISQVSLPMYQWDNTRELLINLTDSGTPYIIERGCYAFLAATNSQGEEIILPCTIVKKTTINIVLGNVITKVPGVVDCEIRLYGANNELITSPSFILVVQKRVVSDDSDSVKEEDLPLLNQLMGEEAKRVAAEEKRVEAEGVRQTQFETLVSEISNTKDNAIETENLARSALSQANAANAQASTALNTANDALQSANDALNDAENAKDAALEAAGITVSPEVSVVSIANGHRVTIKDVNGTRTFDVMNGERGQDGEDGKDAEGVRIETGSYVGVGLTGTGKSKKTLTFDFSPKIVVVQSVSTDSLSTGLFVSGCNRVLNFNSGGTASIAKTGASWGEKTITMSSTSSYGNATMAEEAFNAVDVTYNYVAIG